MSIHGLRPGSKTALSETKHLPECWQILGFQKTVISPFEYFFVNRLSMGTVTCV